MNPIDTNPLAFRLARAYGLRPVRPMQPVQPVQPARADDPAGAEQTVGAGSRRADTVELSTNVAARDGIAKLVAARVPGSIDFTLTNEGVMAPGEAGAMKLHRHPADLNSAATGVALGRAIDLEA